MSHLSVGKCKIQSPNMALLRAAAEKVAEKLGAKVVDASEVRLYSGSKIKAGSNALGIKGGKLYYGYIIEVDKSGNINIKGDQWRSDASITQVSNMLETAYTREAAIDSLQELGFSVVSEEENDEKVVITAEDTSIGVGDSGSVFGGW